MPAAATPARQYQLGSPARQYQLGTGLQEHVSSVLPTQSPSLPTPQPTANSQSGTPSLASQAVGPFGEENIAALTGTSSDIAYNPGGAHIGSAAQANNRYWQNLSDQVQTWNQSGLNSQLQQMIATGNFAGAFQAAANAGQLNAMLEPMNLAQIVPGGQMSEAQFSQYYQAFAPYQGQLRGSSQGALGQSDSAWSAYNPDEAARSWAAVQTPSIGEPFKDIPNPVMFGQSTQASDLQMTEELAGLALSVAAPELAPLVGAELGVGATAAGAITGAGAGALTGYGASGTGAGALKGAALGGLGGGLAAGGAQSIAQETGLPQSVVGTGIRTATGAISGGVPGAVAGLASGAISSGLSASGVPQGVSGVAGGILGTEAAGALSSPTGATMPQGQYQLGDPSTAGLIGSTGTLPSTAVPEPAQVGTGGATSPTGVASPATSPTTDTTGTEVSSILGTLFGAPTAGNPLSGIGTYGALAGLGIAQANSAQSSNASTIAPAYQIGQPLVNEGNSLLSQFNNNQLTGPQQQVVNTSQQQGQTLINAATPVGQLAQGLMQQYQSGQLKPADQAQLDQSTAAAKAQIAQALGPNVDSTTLATYNNQIDQQALITKQNMLNSYLATGNTEFDQWAATTQAGQQTILQGQQYAVTQIDQTFSQALQSSSLGGSDIMQGIQLAVQSNTQIADALQSYMGNLAKAFALQKAGGTAAGAAGAGAAGANAAGAAGGLVSGAMPGGGNLSDIGITPTDVNAGYTGGAPTEAQQVEQGQEDALYNTLPDSNVNSIINGPSYSDQMPGEALGGYY